MLKKIILICLISISGCSWFADKRVVVPPEPLKPVSNKQRWLMLAPFIKKRFQTDMTVEEIAAELLYQEYLLFSKPTNELSKK